jgi:pilus assembly protein CpaB
MSIKKNRLLMIGALALGSGLLAGVLALKHLGSQGVTPLVTEARATGTRLAVAAQDLQVGSVLRAEDIRLIDWPSDVLPAGFSGSPEDLVGRGLVSEVRVNEPLLATKLADREAGGGLPILIGEGMRAVSVRVDDVIAVAGYVIPGTRVDVLVTVAPGNSDTNAITRVVLQNVSVLSAGQTIQRDEEGKPQTVSVVTLLVTPEDGERLVHSANQGRVQLALRNTLDTQETTTSGARIAHLVGGGAPAPAAPAARAARPAPAQPNRAVVETIRGNQRSTTTYQGSR